MINNNPGIGGAAVVRAIVAENCPLCGEPIEIGDLVVQPHGIRQLFCAPCGIQAMQLLPEPDGQGASFDAIESLSEEYSLRRALGWPTPPAVLVFDPENGPTWRVGTSNPGDHVVARGLLVGDEVEVTITSSLSDLG